MLNSLKLPDPAVSYLQKPERLRYATTGMYIVAIVAFPMHAFRRHVRLSAIKHFPCTKNRTPNAQCPNPKENAIIINQIYHRTKSQASVVVAGWG